jgi:hypothetical protein
MNALQKQVRRGATAQSVVLRAQTGPATSFNPEVSVSEATTGLVLKYHRFGDSTAVDGGTSIAPVSIAGLSASHNPGGIKHVAFGCYRIDVPDAAFAKAVGVNEVLVTASATGIVFHPVLIQLVDGDRAVQASTPQSY